MRVIGPAAGAETAESVKVTFAYDYRGRRIEKIVYDYDWDEPNEVWVVTPAVHRTFVYDGWQPLLELDVDPADPNDRAVLRSYTWGPDVSGSLGGAGGIGGLLALADPNDPNDPNDLFGEFVVFYDASGNVGQLVNLDPNDPDDPNTAIAAHYEYDPFGNLLVADGPYAEENPFRFSTKQLDAETGLYNFGQRYYRPDIGRWLNRDPIGELGGVNLYAYVANDPLNKIDPLGTMWIPCHGPNCGDDGLGDDPTGGENDDPTGGDSTFYCPGADDDPTKPPPEDAEDTFDPNEVVPCPADSGCEPEPCLSTYTVKGHGLFMGPGKKKDIDKGREVPVGMTNGIYADAMLIKDDIAGICGDLCEDATLNLEGCGVGNNEAYMRELASGCPKINRVCGYKSRVKYIPGTEVTFSLPWNWKCIDVGD